MMVDVAEQLGLAARLDHRTLREAHLEQNGRGGK
jgi:hypothetical protein